MKELMIINEELPLIDVNFDEVKADLKVKLDEYQKLVVTEDSLSFCKSEQKYLAGLRNKVEKYRKDIKKKMNEPIKTFEGKCKELVELVEEAEAPIKEGIKVFDDKRREEKKLYAISEISRVANELKLESKYLEQLQVEDKYMNLTAKEKEVTADIEHRANLLLIEQKREKEVIETIKSTLERVNKNITQQLEMRDFLFYIKSDASLVDINNEIHKKAEQIAESEKKVKEEAEEKAKLEAEIEKRKAVEEAEIKARIEKEEAEKKAKEELEEVKKNTIEIVKADEVEPKLSYTLKLTGTKKQLEALRRFIDDSAIQYEVIK